MFPGRVKSLNTSNCGIFAPRIREVITANPRDRFRESAKLLPRIREMWHNLPMNMRKRHVLSLVEEELDTFPAVVIQGARQVGKSTLSNYLSGQRDGTTVTLDDPAILGAVSADPAGFIAQYNDSLLVIDEIQRAPSLVLPIKASIDRDRRPGRYLLTGSSDLLRHQGVPDSLAGRAVTAPLYGFSQGELDHTSDCFVDEVISGFEPAGYESQIGRREAVERIVAGGYPEAQNLSDRMRGIWFEGYVERLLRRDTQDLRVRIPETRLIAILRLLAANQAGELVKARLGRDGGVPETSVPTTLDVLSSLYLTTALPPWTPNLTSREVSRPKMIVLDSGLAAYLSRLSPQALADPLRGEHLGPLLEGFVAAELLKQRSWSQTPYEVFHWRDRDGKEVDLLLQLPDGGIIAIEVKAAAAVNAKHFAGLRTLREKLGDRFLAGFVVHLGSRGFSFGDRLGSLPLDGLWRH